MKLYLLKPFDDPRQYDTNQGFVIAADTPHRARLLAQKQIADERFIEPNFWMSTGWSSCQEISKETNIGKGIVLRDFKAG